MYKILQGDVIEKLAEFPDGSFHGCLTDPPYALGEKRNMRRATPRESSRGKAAGFMGMEWDSDIPTVEVWAEVLRVLKPGAMLLAFGGTRTYHRLMCNIEDAGFEIRDCMMWLYGSGFPKSLDISKAIDKEAGAEREALGVKRSGCRAARGGGEFVGSPTIESEKWQSVTAPATPAAKTWAGYGTALKPAYEIIIGAQKPYDIKGLCGIMVHRIGNQICQLSLRAKAAETASQSSRNGLLPLDSVLWDAVRKCNTPGALFGLMDTLPCGLEIPSSLNTGLSWLQSLGVILKHENTFTTEIRSSLTTDLRILNSLSFPNTPEDIIAGATHQHGIGSDALTAVSIFNAVEAKLRHILTPSVRGPVTSRERISRLDVLGNLSPAWEPIIVAMKPTDGTFANNALKHGVAGINVDGSRVPVSDAAYAKNCSGDRGHDQDRQRRSGFQVTCGSASDVGRWPANLILDEDWIPVRYLKYNIDSGVSAAIKEYFNDYHGLQDVRQIDGNVPKPEGQEEVLRSEVLRQSTQPKQPRRSAPDVRKASQPSLYREDESRADGGSSSGRGLIELAGWEVCEQGIRDALSVGTIASGPSSCGSDVKQEPGLSPRTSARDGSGVGSSVDTEGDPTPQERGQERQPSSQSGDGRQRHAQDDPPASRPGTTETSERERGSSVATLEVLESDIPAVWLKYFGYTGKAVRIGSAEMLDRQSGTLTSGANPTERHSDKTRSVYGAFKGHECKAVRGADSGGASRFFYCAKASASERTLADGTQIDHPTMKPLALTTYLARLILPPCGGSIFVPYSGVASEVIGAIRAGWTEVTGIDLSPDYCEMAERRIRDQAPLFHNYFQGGNDDRSHGRDAT